ncbi:TonB-dependent receptor [Rubrivirga marina]|uniref:TonB-dependent transporter Oar-like beta-barrel domain-containing protein n=1 Tax=Rubrivirga marina TaxID=1196024 RepID=A0A271IZM7_9BACT|nr:TonB-dependent receptor [Rubrivirga marina]PAP76672.1 hypothetical protein BSZ37_09575 [Rubrivirga marina]
MTSVTIRRLAMALLALVAAPAFSQGVTTAAMNGTVTDEAGLGLPGATVLAVHEPSGTQYGISTRADGQFDLRNLRVGGPYTVTVSFVGYTTVQQTGITLELSENEQVDVQLTPADATIGEAVVTAEGNAIISSSNIGTGTNVSEEEIERLPTITRSLTDFTRLTPQFSQVGSGSEAGTSVGGTSSRYNNIQVDGAALNDAFGLESSGTPGGSSGTQPISLDAVSEFRVAIAPYDVSQGGFTGGNINVITRSGTNTFTGSVYGLGRNQDLVGTGVDGDAFNDFTDVTYGGRLGGPILRDKLFFFGSVEIGDTNEPIVANFNDAAAAQEIQTILETQYGRETGTIGTFDAGTQSAKVFGRLDYNINPSNNLTARFNYVQGKKDDGISRSSNFYTLEDRLYTRQNTNTSSVVELRSILGQNAANLLRASLQTNRQPSVLEFPAFPSIEIRGLGSDGRATVVAGPDQFRGANRIDADVFELVNDFNYFVGDHVVTVGTQNTFSSFENLFIRNFYGYYRFSNLEDFRNGRASLYERNYSAIAGEDRPLADFSYANFSLYAQDEWTGIENLKLTGGLRVDMAHFFDQPSPAYDASSGASFESLFGFDNTEVPNGNPVFQPRFGFNYSVPGERSTQIRGGTGLFNGSNPAVWISNSFSNDGTLLGGVSVRNADQIAAAGGFRTDPANQYTAADFGFAEGSAEINFTDPDFKSPTVWRSNIAVDQELPGGLVATGEFLYTDVVNGVQWQSLNRQPFVLDPNTVDGRTGVTRARVSGDYQDVIVLTNTDQGYAYNLTGQLQKPIGTGAAPQFGGSLSYTFGQVKDINSVTSSQARSNVRDLTVGLDVNDPPLTTSNFEVAHRVLATASYGVEYGGRFATTFSLIYDGQAGRPYSFVYSSGDDVNGDGFDRADLVYVPASRDEVVIDDAEWTALDAFIEGNEALREQRGQIFERNSTRAPWLHFLDARVAQSIQTLTGQDVEITLDIQNVLDLLGTDLGQVETVGDRFELLEFGGYDAQGRQIISFETPTTIAEVSDFASRWRMQLGLRYNF